MIPRPYCINDAEHHVARSVHQPVKRLHDTRDELLRDVVDPRRIGQERVEPVPGVEAAGLVRPDADVRLGDQRESVLGGERARILGRGQQSPRSRRNTGLREHLFHRPAW